jgi:hypothetical protein
MLWRLYQSSLADLHQLCLPPVRQTDSMLELFTVNAWSVASHGKEDNYLGRSDASVPPISPYVPKYEYLPLFLPISSFLILSCSVLKIAHKHVWTIYIWDNRFISLVTRP